MKGKHRIPKNYKVVTLTVIAAKIYNVQLLNCILPEVEKVLWKNQNSLQRNWSTTSQLLIVWQIIEEIHANNLVTTFLFVFFSKKFDLINKGKMGQIWVPKRNCYYYNKTLQKYESNGLLTQGSHWFPWHCCCSATTRYIRTISILNLPRL